MEISSIQTPHAVDPAMKHSSKMLTVAKEFESLFASIVVRSMRRTILDSGIMEKSFGEEVYTDLLDGEYARLIAGNGTLGLAEHIVKEMERHPNGTAAYAPLTALREQVPRSSVLYEPNRRHTTPSASDIREWTRQWEPFIQEASRRYAVDEDLITAMIVQESAGNPYAVSCKGAKGLMQLIDSTAAAMGVKKVFDPRENILGGVRYLASLRREFGDDETLALASYNAGPAAVKKYGAIPPFRETREYVERIAGMKQLLQCDSAANTPVQEER